MAGRSEGPLVAASATAAVIEQLGDPELLLTPAELGRAGRLRSASDRSDFVAAHGLVRLVAARLLGVVPAALTVVQRCPSCGGDHGPPRIVEAPALQVGWSHTRGFVAAIAGFVPVAVDVDQPRPRTPDGALLRLALSPAEQAVVAAALDPAFAFTRYWVRKESAVKLGLSTLDTLAATDVAELPVEPPWAPAPAGRALTWEGWHLLEWSHPATRTLGTALAAAPPSLIGTGSLTAAGTQ